MGHEYDDILFSVMCLAAQSRLRRTKNFGKFMRSVDNDFSSSSWLPNSLIGDIKEFFNNIFGPKVKRGDIFNKSDSRDFMMFDFEFFENKYQDGYADVRSMKQLLKDKFVERKHFLAEAIQSCEPCDKTVEIPLKKPVCTNNVSPSICSSVSTVGECDISDVDDVVTFATEVNDQVSLSQTEFDRIIDKRCAVDDFSLIIKDKTCQYCIQKITWRFF